MTLQINIALLKFDLLGLQSMHEHFDVEQQNYSKVMPLLLAVFWISLNMSSPKPNFGMYILVQCYQVLCKSLSEPALTIWVFNITHSGPAFQIVFVYNPMSVKFVSLSSRSSKTNFMCVDRDLWEIMLFFPNPNSDKM